MSSKPGGESSAEPALEAFFAGGEMGRLIAALDWSDTPIGPIETWPQSLQTAVSICLLSRFPMLIWWGPSLVKIYNDAYRPLVGDKHPASMGQRGAQCWPEIWPIIGPMLDRVLRTGEATWSDGQLLLLDRSGYLEECYFTFSYSPIRDESGGVGGVFTAVHETTAQVVGERRLRGLRDLGKTSADVRSVDSLVAGVTRVLEQYPDDLPVAALCLLGPGGDVYQAAAVGLPQGSDHWAVGLDPGEGPMLLDGLVEQRGRLGPWADTQPVEQALVVPIDDAAFGQRAGFLVAGISPRRPLDDDYRRFLLLCAAQIGTAIGAIRSFEAERRRADALAELDRAKTAFFSNVSHELRTPLSLILGPLEQLGAAGQALSEEQTEDVSLAYRNARRLLRLVNNLLDFSRLEAGRLEVSFEPTDLAAYTAELASSFQSLVETAGLGYEVHCAPLPAPVPVDREMWEKIVLNLLSNAFKFTLHGRITVRLRPEGTCVVLEVADTGCGIGPDELPRIFERFHRVRTVEARSHEGTGIGLALVDELARLHGGRVDAESVLGAGTTVRVRVPLGPAPASRTAPQTPTPPDRIPAKSLDAHAFVEEASLWLPGQGDVSGDSDAAERAPQLTERWEEAWGRRVLVVDDNADMRAYLTRLLSPQCAVTTAVNGAEALAKARRWPPDLIVADVMMPVMDGLALVAELRSDDELRAVPVMLLSARAGEEAAIEGLAAGANDYLVKPFQAKALIAKVQANLEAAEARRAQLRQAERLAYIGAWTWDVGQDTVVWSDEMYRVFGLPPQSRPLSYQGFLDLVHPDDRAMVDERVRRSSATGEAFAFYYRLVRPDGSVRWVHTQGQVAMGNDGPVRMFGTGRDVTSERQATDLVAVQTSVLEEIVTGRPLPEVLDTLVRGIERQSDGMIASVLVLDESGTRLRHGAAPGLPDAYNRAIDGLEIGPCAGSCGTAAHLGGSVIVEDVATDPLWAQFRDLAAEHGLGACWSVPIFAAGGAVLGTFALYYREPRAPDERHVGLIEAASHLAAVAIGASRDRQALKQSEERYRTLVSEAPVGIFLADEEGNNVFTNEELTRIVGRPAAQMSGQGWAEHVHPDDRGRVSEERLAAVACKNPWSSEYRVRRDDGTVRWVAVGARPQTIADRVIGFIGTYADVTVRKETEALARAEAERQRLRQVFDQAPAAILVLKGPRHIVEFVNDAYFRILPGRADVIGKSVRNAWPELEGQPWFDLLDRVYATGEPFRADEMAMQIDRHGAGELEEIYLNTLYTPLCELDGGIEGVVVHAVEVTDAVGARKALERSLEAERLVAHTLQQSLLPETLPDLPGLAIAARYLPGSKGLNIGGDWYDVFLLPTGAIAFAIGDVVGRGLSAAATMGQLRTALRACALGDPSPVRVLDHLSDLVDNLGRGEMATVVYGVFEPSSHRVRLACAGHLPPLLVGANGQVRYLEQAQRPPLGLPSLCASETVVSLEHGSTLLLYTDGLVERRTRSLDDGLAALAEAASASSPDAEALCDHVLAGLLGGDTVQDDVALLALSPTPFATEGFTLALPAEPSMLRAFRQAMSGWLEELGASVEERTDIVLACNEAIANAVEHAYGPGAGLVEVAGRVNGETVEIAVKDFGAWRAPGRGSGGRGISIMEGLMESVEVASDESGTQVRLTRRLGVHPPDRTTAVFAPPAAGRVLTGEPVPVLRLPQGIDLANAPAMERQVARTLGNDALGLVVDLSGTEHLDSAGLRMLFTVAARLQTRRQHLRLVVPEASPLRRVLSLTDPGRLLRLAPSVGQAIEEVTTSAQPSEPDPA